MKTHLVVLDISTAYVGRLHAKPSAPTSPVPSPVSSRTPSQSPPPDFPALEETSNNPILTPKLTPNLSKHEQPRKANMTEVTERSSLLPVLPAKHVHQLRSRIAVEYEAVHQHHHGRSHGHSHAEMGPSIVVEVGEEIQGVVKVGEKRQIVGILVRPRPRNISRLI
jgi:hypothetical protein